MKLGQQGFLATARLEVPFRPGGDVALKAILEGEVAGHEDLRRLQAGQLGAQRGQEVAAFDLGGGELAGGDIRVGDAGLFLLQEDGGQIVVDVAMQQARLDHRSGGDHAGDAAREKPLHRQIPHLLADGHVVAFFDQAGQVIFHRVVGNAGHGHARAFSHVAGSQDDVQLARGNLGVLVERLVEIAQAEEEDRLGILALDFQILLPDGGDVFRHKDRI